MKHTNALRSPSLKRMVSSSRIMCLALALAVPTLLFGQSFTASVRGVVTDSAQAAVPAAKSRSPTSTAISNTQPRRTHWAAT